MALLLIMSMDSTISLNSRSSVNEYSTRAMINVLSRYREGFKVCHLNARSLNPLKLDYLRYIFANSPVDVICVSETWFKSEIPDSFYSIYNYNLHRNDRVTSTIGGGVAVYIKSTLKCKVVGASDLSGVEYLIVEVHDGSAKCLVSCTYNPNRSCSPEPFFTALSEYSVSYDHVIICGDFNADLLKSDLRAFQIYDLASSLGLQIVNSSNPTCFSINSTPSLLDLIIVSNPLSVLLFDQLSLDYISDHDLVFCTYDVNFSHSAIRLSFTYKDFSAINALALQTALSSAPWYRCRLSANSDEKLNIFQELVCYLFAQFVPLKLSMFVIKVVLGLFRKSLSKLKLVTSYIPNGNATLLVLTGLPTKGHETVQLM